MGRSSQTARCTWTKSAYILSAALCFSLVQTLGCAKEHEFLSADAAADPESDDAQAASGHDAEDAEGMPENDREPGADASSESDAEPTFDSDPELDAGASGASDAGAQGDAGEPDFRLLFVEYLAESQRGSVLHCPCYVANDAFSSEEECVQAVGVEWTVAECVNDLIPDALTDEFRAWFGCMTRAKKAINACLEAKTCFAEEGCRDDSAHCRQPDLTQLASIPQTCPRVVEPRQ